MKTFRLALVTAINTVIAYVSGSSLAINTEKLHCEKGRRRMRACHLDTKDGKFDSNLI
jgi:hypothetical protein